MNAVVPPPSAGTLPRASMLRRRQQCEDSIAPSLHMPISRCRPTPAGLDRRTAQIDRPLRPHPHGRHRALRRFTKACAGLVDETAQRACVAAKGAAAADPICGRRVRRNPCGGWCCLMTLSCDPLARLDNRRAARRQVLISDILEGASHAHHHQLRDASLDRLDCS